MTVLEALYARHAELTRQLTEVTEQIEAERKRLGRLSTDLPYDDFMGQPVAVTAEFCAWLAGNKRPPYIADLLKVQSTEKHWRGWTVTLADNDRVIRGVPNALAQDMRREYKRRGQGK